jgi:predicted nucleic acid-binding protein
MRVYLDSSAIVRLYIPEAETPSVVAYVRTLNEPLPFSHLHEIEVKNALRLKVFRKEAPSRPVLKSIRIIDNDVASRLLQRPELNWIDVFRRAEELSKRFTSRSGSRSLDLLHVASSLLIPCRDFLTFDDRQAVAAQKAGLRIVRLPKSTGSSM